jgi:hypothetical protein
VGKDSDRRLLQPATGRDVTVPMERFSKNLLDNVEPVDGFILKSRSPSCGIKDVKAMLPPIDCQFADNYVSSEGNRLIDLTDANATITWKNNVMWGGVDRADLFSAGVIRVGQFEDAALNPRLRPYAGARRIEKPRVGRLGTKVERENVSARVEGHHEEEQGSKTQSNEDISKHTAFTFLILPTRPKALRSNLCVPRQRHIARPGLDGNYWNCGE